MSVRPGAVLILFIYAPSSSFTGFLEKTANFFSSDAERSVTGQHLASVPWWTAASLALCLA